MRLARDKWRTAVSTQHSALSACGVADARPATAPPLSTLNSRLSTAFTLIEVLLAIGILALVMTAIYASWAAVLRGAKIGNAAADEVQRMRIARQALEQSLASAVFYASNPRYYSFIADTTDEKFALLTFPAAGCFRTSRCAA